MSHQGKQTRLSQCPECHMTSWDSCSTSPTTLSVRTCQQDELQRHFFPLSVSLTFPANSHQTPLHVTLSIGLSHTLAAEVASVHRNVATASCGERYAILSQVSHGVQDAVFLLSLMYVLYRLRADRELRSATSLVIATLKLPHSSWNSSVRSQSRWKMQDVLLIHFQYPESLRQSGLFGEEVSSRMLTSLTFKIMRNSIYIWQAVTSNQTHAYMASIFYHPILIYATCGSRYRVHHGIRSHTQKINLVSHGFCHPCKIRITKDFGQLSASHHWVSTLNKTGTCQ